MAAEEDVRTRLNALIEQFNNATKDNVDELMDFHAPDCEILGPGKPILYGLEGVQTTMSALKEAPVVLINVNTRLKQLADNVVIQTTSFAGEYKESNERRNCKVLNIWTKQPDGQWKLFRSAFNFDLA